MPGDALWTRQKNAKMIEEYIQSQIEEELASDQITLKE